MSSEAKKLSRGDEITLEIERLAFGGKGVGKYEGYVVFVPHTAPGDLIRARVWKRKRRYADADLLEVVRPGPGRVEPTCAHVGQCGGCSWQHLSYEAQLEAKAAEVREALVRLGGIADPPMRPIIGSESPLGYRNKMEFAFHPEAPLGLHERGRFDKVFPLTRCHLTDPLASELVAAISEFTRDHALSCYDKREHVGLLRHLVFRRGHHSGEVMVALVTTSEPFPQREAFTQLITERFPEVTSLLWARTDDLADAVTVDAVELLHGRDHIFDSLRGVRYAIRLETFFQTNTPQAERLVEEVLQLAEPQPTDTLVDLFCGVGTFALQLAPLVKQVWGVELVERSIVAARENAAQAGVENAEFLVSDARRGLTALVEREGSPDLFIIDPPRSGAGGKVMRRIGRAQPRRLVYVSCNPTTLAPDLAEILPFGYTLKAVQPVDLFPQTWHVETVALLERSGPARDEAGSPAAPADAPGASP